MVPKNHTTPPSRARQTPTPTPASIEPSQLGLSNAEEVAIFRRHQQAALNSSRGTEAARAVAARGRVLVDASSLQLLTNHFNHVMAGIQQRADLLTRQTQSSVQRQTSRSITSVQAADAEIARVHALLRQIDDLEVEFDKIRRIRDIVASFRARVEALERRV